MASGTLYTFPVTLENFRAVKVLVAAEFSGASVKVACKAPEFDFGVTNKSPEYLVKFPLGKVPAFESSDGHCIYDSNAIAYFVCDLYPSLVVANEQLRGKSTLDSAHIQQYVNLADHEILPAVCTLTFPTLGLLKVDKKDTQAAMDQVKLVLQVLDNVLLQRTFLVGERITLADISVVSALLMLFKQILDPATRASFPNATRWFTTCINQPQFRKVLGDVKLCDEPASFDAKLYAELHGDHHGERHHHRGEKKDHHRGEKKDHHGEKKDHHHGEKDHHHGEKKDHHHGEKKDHHHGDKKGHHQGEKVKQDAKPDKKPKEKAPEEAAEEIDAADAALAEEPKKVDRFSHLPPSKFVLDEWKKIYSNQDTITVAIPWFWENFDSEGWSIWYTEYKYPQDLSLVFMTCNLVSGMFQRLDKLRKHAFGSICIFGSDNNNTISGIWVLRGQELAFNLDEDWQVDSPSYDFKKLDASTAEDKVLINEYLLWEGQFGGKKFNQGKIFK